MNKLICIDSDGCAIDSMNAKHQTCFGPALLDVWRFAASDEAVLRRWDTINLFSATRGINRFQALAALLRQAENDSPREEIEAFAAWTAAAPELSNAAVEALVKNGAAPVFGRALDWSRRVNARIAQLPPARPFPGVAECLAFAAAQSRIAVVSSANREAILAEWERGGLTRYVQRFFSQADGSKAQCIAALCAQGCRPADLLMVGDAPGDAQAAAENGVCFYPILAGREAESWQALRQTELAVFLAGEWTAEHQADLLRKMQENLAEMREK